LITTGTPAGVSQLAHGDLLNGTISKIGEMKLHVIDQA
jgi:2-keto-4-pentenoate hydratase/2-oxohepta-3-ene-1,7-dioic acid hydratase in catechol pathway